MGNLEHTATVVRCFDRVILITIRIFLTSADFLFGE